MVISYVESQYVWPFVSGVLFTWISLAAVMRIGWKEAKSEVWLSTVSFSVSRDWEGHWKWHCGLGGQFNHGAGRLKSPLTKADWLSPLPSVQLSNNKSLLWTPNREKSSRRISWFIGSTWMIDNVFLTLWKELEFVLLEINTLWIKICITNLHNL